NREVSFGDGLGGRVWGADHRSAPRYSYRLLRHPRVADAVDGRRAGHGRQGRDAVAVTVSATARNQVHFFLREDVPQHAGFHFLVVVLLHTCSPSTVVAAGLPRIAPGQAQCMLRGQPAAYAAAGSRRLNSLAIPSYRGRSAR